jgi:hypothetical protein
MFSLSAAGGQGIPSTGTVIAAMERSENRPRSLGTDPARSHQTP